MTFEYELKTGPISSATVQEIQRLSERVFGNYFETEGDWRFGHMPDMTVFEARSEGALVGFKIGYALTQTRYYSWLGGVVPEYRRDGVAQALLSEQEERVRGVGYLRIRVKSMRKFPGMLALLQTNGYTLVPARGGADSAKLTFEKRL